ncbi:MAG: AAA family ATPase, partial [Rubripirellula sp.]
MILSRLDLKAFGRFTDVSLDLSAGPRRFHLVYGPNESGKSTSLRAITSLLFGMPHVAEDNYLHTNAQLRVGGLLVDERTGAQLECVRRRGRKATLRDGVDDAPISDAQLDEMLGGITRETFTTRFGLSHEELVAGGAAILSGEGDLGQILFAAGAGVGRLREIQDELDEAGNRLFTARGSKTVINSAVRELDEQRKSLREAQVPPAEFAELNRKVEQRKESADELTQRMHDKVLSVAKLRSYQQAWPLLPQWRAAIEGLKEVKAAPALDEDFTERRRQAVSDRELARSRQQELETRHAELTTRIEQLPVDAEVLNQENEIQSLFQEVAARDKADRDRLGLMRTIKNADRKITELLGQLSVEIEASDEDAEAAAIDESVERLKVSDSLRVRIRGLASDHGRLIGQRNDASDAVETVKRRLSDVTQELDSLKTLGDPTALSSTLETVGNPQVILDTVAEQQEATQTLNRQCDDLLRKLDGFSGTVEQAVRLQPPTEAAIQRQANQLRNSYQEVLRSSEGLEQLKERQSEAERQLRSMQQQQPLPTHEELAASRSRRDHAIDELVDQTRAGSISAELIEYVRQGVRETDQLVDTIRTHSEKVHQREAMQRQVSDLTADLTKAKSSADESQAVFEAAKTEWLTTWRACDVEPGQPEQMQRWIGIREQLCDTVGRLREEEQR